MKFGSKEKYKYSIIVFLTMISLTGCGMSSVNAVEQASDTIKDTEVISITDTLAKNSNSTITKFQDTVLVFNEYGYEYSVKKPYIEDFSHEQSDCDILNVEAGLNAEANDTHEQIFSSWDDAKMNIDSEKVKWLYNETLNAQADDISVIISDSDAIIARYNCENYEADIEVVTVAGTDDKYFEYGRSYPSKLYNICQDESQQWNIFSFKDYESKEYTSAVWADEKLLIEITVDKCDVVFVQEIIEGYN